MYHFLHYQCIFVVKSLRQHQTQPRGPFCIFTIGEKKRDNGRESLTMTIHFISNLSLSTLQTRNSPRHEGVWTKILKEFYKIVLVSAIKNPQRAYPLLFAGFSGLCLLAGAFAQEPTNHGASMLPPTSQCLKHH